MRRVVLLESWWCAALMLVGSALPVTATPDPAAHARLSEVYGKLPLSFAANEGQADGAVRFLSRGRGYTLFFTAAESALSLAGPQHHDTVVRMQVDGGNSSPRVVGVDPQAETSNYFLGNDPRRWHVGVAHYALVRYEAVYPGVDLLYRGNQRQLEYDFVVAPGADPRRIRLAFKGVDSIAIGSRGELILHTASGDLVQPAATVYQESRTGRERVKGHYLLLAPQAGKHGGEGAPHRVGFAVGRYDRTRPLIIDPVIVYSSFLGGSGADSASGIAVDGAGNAYVTGMTRSVTLPGISGSSIQATNGGGLDDAFVMKINAAGTAIVYSTFLGGNGLDEGAGIAVDGAGNAYIAGATLSTSFPGVTAGSIQPANAGGADGFVTKLNPTGTAIIYSTFLGGLSDDSCLGIAVDGAGNAYVTGQTNSSSFPGVGGSSIQQTKGGVFVTKINAAGTAIVYSTFLGANDPNAFTAGIAIAVDSVGNAYVTGTTTATTFTGVTAGSLQPVNASAFNGGNDGFVTKINSAGTAIVYSTFLGGSGIDWGHGIAVDGAGNAYVTGQTTSTTFPGVTAGSIQPVNGGGTDAFVTKINATGTAIVYSTFLGGSGDDAANGIAVDGAGNAYVTGSTGSTTFTGVTAGSIQPAFGGGDDDAFVTMINAAGTAIVYSTFLGGAGTDNGLGIAVDGIGNAYVAGSTGSATFPGVNGSSIQPTYGGLVDAFVTKIGTPPPLNFFTVSPCRIVDTRTDAGSNGGPALQPGAQRNFPLAGACGVPTSAIALSVNVTITEPGAAGDLRLFPAGLPLPLVSTINFQAGQTRANNAVVSLGAAADAGQITVQSDCSSTVQFILDVNGYFE